MADPIFFDVAKLNAYLNDVMPEFEGEASVSKFAGGQSNPTFKLSTPSREFVMRSQPPGKLLPSAHAVDREYRVLKALAGSEVPVAQAYHLCQNKDITGTEFYVMEFCEGNIYWDAALPELDNAGRGKIYDEMNRVLAAMHSLDLDVVGLSDYGKPGNYFERQYKRWQSQYRASELQTIDEMERLMDWLGERIPEDDGCVSLVHGDYRLDNIMFAKDNSRAIAVLDWELSTLGHPLADLSYQCMQMHLPPSNNGVSGLLGIDKAALGIPDEEQYVADYCERRGLKGIDNWSFYMGFSFFRLAAIIQGVAKRAADGNASNAQAAKLGELVQPLSGLALMVVEA